MSDSGEQSTQASDASGEAGHKANRIFLVVVDATEEVGVALRFASRRAANTHGRVALLYVMEPADFQHWMAVGEKMRAERREEAEHTLQELAADVNALTGEMPIIYLREGKASDLIAELIEEEPDISILVLGAGTGKKDRDRWSLRWPASYRESSRFPVPLFPEICRWTRSTR